jgi:FAD/FMN-containing dehydrogenase
MPEPRQIVNDVTGLNPIPVFAVATPTSVAEVQEAVRRTNGPLSIGGGRFSMGGQIASPGSLHLDLRGLNQIVRFQPVERILRVQAGARWCDVQRFVDPHGLAVKIMQSYANFTVGGSLSVNVHGRYMGLGPLVLSVRALSLVLADGEQVEASPSQNAELFWGAIGGYGGLGVIVEAELDLAENVRLARRARTMPVGEYLEHFRSEVRHSPEALLHNADLYPPHYASVRSVTWSVTDEPASVPRVQPARRGYPMHRYFIWAATETPLAEWRRQHIVDRHGGGRGRASGRRPGRTARAARADARGRRARAAPRAALPGLSGPRAGAGPARGALRGDRRQPRRDPRERARAARLPPVAGGETPALRAAAADAAADRAAGADGPRARVARGAGRAGDAAAAPRTRVRLLSAGRRPEHKAEAR